MDNKKFKKNQEEGEYRGICPCCMYYCPYGYMVMMNQFRFGRFPEMMSQSDGMYMRQQPCDGFMYTVRQGDSLYSIAQHYKVSLNDLIEANPLITNPNAITVGQTICVPGVMPLPTPVECEGVVYTVRAGDTLYAIARKYNVTVSDIVAANPIITNPDNLVVGWNLCIPVEEPVPPECEGEIYTVRAGDTLYAIARRFNVTVSEILAVNPLITDPNNIVVGLKVCIPVEEPVPPECEGEIYTVRAGDTLYAIARRFNVTVSAILAANPLITDPNNIVAGLNICIPNACSGRIYTIRQGDTMAGIAQNFGVSYQSLLQANPQITDPNKIFVGQNICIPRS